MSFLDRFREITEGKVIEKRDYGAIAEQSSHVDGYSLIPTVPGTSERYSVIVRGTVRPGGKEYQHEIYVWGFVWGSISVGDKWPTVTK